MNVVIAPKKTHQYQLVSESFDCHLTNLTFTLPFLLLLLVLLLEER